MKYVETIERADELNNKPCRYYLLERLKRNDIEVVRTKTNLQCALIGISSEYCKRVGKTNTCTTMKQAGMIASKVEKGLFEDKKTFCEHNIIYMGEKTPKEMLKKGYIQELPFGVKPQEE